MKTGRPKSGEHRESEHTRLPVRFKTKCKKIAQHRKIPIGDVIEQLAGKDVDREYDAIVAAERDTLGEAGA